VNAVGGIKGALQKKIWEISEDNWDGTVALNLKGTLLCSQAVIPHMIAASSGSIVNIASVAWPGYPYNIAYSSAKAAVVSVTRSQRRHLVPRACG
jgi:3-oxoacyl-[acyl-carrier protein] reductase/2-[hydroxy(phenyl)methyl]-succinyl-CoA dehydrogenase BbsD subunit